MRMLDKLYLNIMGTNTNISFNSREEFEDYLANNTIDGTDNILKLDSQNDRYIDEINTIALDPKNEGNIVSIKNIGYTVLYDKNNNQLIKLDGYLDIGLHDTMKDLIVNTLGMITFIIFEYIYIVNNKKYNFMENFIIKRK